MIYFLLLQFLLAADPTPTPEEEKPKPETTKLKEQKKQAIQKDADELNTLLQKENPKTSDLVSAEDNLNLLRHNPLYFAFGDPLSKVQMSLKHRLVRKQPFYFGFTQIMFWDLGEDSKPFRDTTYNPEFFYTYPFEKDYFINSVDLGVWEHNSNGKDGPASRSFERAYVKINFDAEFQEWAILYSIKLGYLYGLDRTNEDIQEYISPLELQATLVGLLRGKLDKSALTLRYFPGGKYADDWDQGGFEVGLSFRWGGLDIIPAFYIQYFNGYAESLVNYNERVNEFRAGFIF
jgi:phospholipase A1/A2